MRLHDRNRVRAEIPNIFFSLYDVKRSRNTARIRDVLSAVSKRLQRRPHDRGPAVQVLTKLLRFHRPLDVRVRRGN